MSVHNILIMLGSAIRIGTSSLFYLDAGGHRGLVIAWEFFSLACNQTMALIYNILSIIISFVGMPFALMANVCQWAITRLHLGINSVITNERMALKKIEGDIEQI